MSTLIKFSAICLVFLYAISGVSQDFQGKAYYYSKSTLELGTWGARMNKQQKDQIAARLKNRLEKTYVLSFNKTESIYKEEEVLDAISGATDSWGKNFTAGHQYKDVKENRLVQSQEFYGKKFLIDDKLQQIEWTMTTEQKKIGNYTCYKSVGVIPTTALKWWSFSWSKLREAEKETSETTNSEDYNLTQIVAWYTPQIPVSHGPSEYWGLPGLILEVSVDNTTILCSKLIINPKEKVEIIAPSKGKQVNKDEYCDMVLKKMKEFRANRMGRRRYSG
ncbi:GLPGLI family protein [Seonamhaeicola marinus]|uniref:GLPGLI family protein n=1 Tax=Seonamhaeicola marinus TaxID=1912246 RepID=A0A5D0HTV2_9FLAO|nr:GLPGLI family protein [Seonamhaeicola marinus]TYA74738.1 GLPGLI family protein [Seonamhaeicola marinus]